MLRRLYQPAALQLHVEPVLLSTQHHMQQLLPLVNCHCCQTASSAGGGTPLESLVWSVQISRNNITAIPTTTGQQGCTVMAYTAWGHQIMLQCYQHHTQHHAYTHNIPHPHLQHPIHTCSTLSLLAATPPILVATPPTLAAPRPYLQLPHPYL